MDHFPVMQILILLYNNNNIVAHDCTAGGLPILSPNDIHKQDSNESLQGCFSMEDATAITYYY